MGGCRFGSIAVACAIVLATNYAAHAQTSNPAATEPAALNAPATAAPAPRPQANLARIWANEPPLVRLARDHFAGQFTENDAKFFAAVAANDWADFRPNADAA